MTPVIRSRLFGMIICFSVGLIGGALWHWMHVFPFPALSQMKTSFERRHYQQEEATHGRWREARSTGGKLTLTEEQERAIRQLRSIGYVAGSDPAPTTSSITIHDELEAHNALNLVVSGHGPEALLMDMAGTTLHRWALDISDVWPDFNPVEHFGTRKSVLHTFWRRAHLMDNGDLLAMFSGIGLIKVNKHSQLIWSVRNGSHHDLYVTPGEEIYVLTEEAHINEMYNPREPILEDFICVLDSHGHELSRLSVLEALRSSPFSAVLNRLEPSGDILHTNTIELIEKPPADTASPFRQGTVLISIREKDMVCAVDLEKKAVYWAESNMWSAQHQPTLLDNGNMLVFDNEGAGEQHSAVLEYDPVQRKIKWSYVGGRAGELFSKTNGSCQRLPNGNTLITESDRGRAFEVTPGGKIVWEYINPHRAGEQDELIATLFEVVRLRDNFQLDWLEHN